MPVCFDFYDGLIGSHDATGIDEYRTVEVEGIWNSNVAGWWVVNTVNGRADAIP